MKQEPKSEAEIKKEMQELYHVQFPLFAKIEVNGPNTHPIYAFLRNHSSLK